MNCKCCKEEIPDDTEVCRHCGADMIPKEVSWHSLHSLLWDNKINQDFLETLNEFAHNKERAKRFVDVARNLHEDTEK